MGIQGIQCIHGDTMYTRYTGHTWEYRVHRAYVGIQGIHGYTWVYRVYIRIQGIQGVHGNKFRGNVCEYRKGSYLS